MTTKKRKAETQRRNAESALDHTGQIVLVLQGGGALGAYQVGVYQALHEAGIEPDWVIGTSIGAINASIIAGNPPEKRLENLEKFWELVEQPPIADIGNYWPQLDKLLANAATLNQGIDKFFVPNPSTLWGPQMAVGAENAAYYSTAPLKETLHELTDFAYINAKHMRLTVGAVNVRSGQMHYFDNRECAITAAYIMASSALPPAFPAVRVGDDLYWDGGIYSNTPIEVVFDDRPRRDSVIFTVNLWHARGPEPKSIWQVLERHKDIQYASRVESHHDRQQQLHRLRHVIRALEQHIPEAHRSQPEVQELLAYGCATHMHIIQLLAPRLEGEDHTKDIDFTQNGIRARWQAGYAHARRAIAEAPWRQELHPLDGAVVHEPS